MGVPRPASVRGARGCARRAPLPDDAARTDVAARLPACVRVGHALLLGQAFALQAAAEEKKLPAWETEVNKSSIPWCVRVTAVSLKIVADFRLRVRELGGPKINREVADGAVVGGHRRPEGQRQQQSAVPCGECHTMTDPLVDSWHPVGNLRPIARQAACQSYFRTVTNNGSRRRKRAR